MNRVASSRSAHNNKSRVVRRDPLGRVPKMVTPGTKDVPALLRKGKVFSGFGQENKTPRLLAELESKSAPVSIAPVCTRDSAPFQSSFALTRVALLLQYVAPGALVAFDIDDTLIKRKHFTCQLVSAEGVIALHSALNTELRDAYPLPQKQAMVNALCEAVRDVVLAEDDTAEVVRALQARGARVFGLTARSPTIIAATRACLGALGIDLSRSAPASLPSQAEDEVTGAVVDGGIVYCGDTDKGVVIDRLLSLGWLSWPAEATPNCLHKSAGRFPAASAAASEESDKAAVAAAAAAGLDKCARDAGRACDVHKHTEDGSLCPERALWFVDDNLSMILGAMKAWSGIERRHREQRLSLGAWAQQEPCAGRISLVCCHYVHPTAAEVAKAASAAMAAAGTSSGAALVSRETLLQCQLRLFVKHGTIVHDNEARLICQEQTKQDELSEPNMLD